ncbi:D-hexose-6-phosphate mutarotase [Ancylomarina sp. 16SWW S1-10-2]|uniref:D-hexose-6-phosphate mutarotase n=1 Tax=Ancylomarina sp. 16SWW S1-10-2 TaxID=2499681 RepID=UPI0012ADE534|nr:D-hexose-6-phosphate mutarotase [Ancylomarina sp. 16SWW S1-10-2]MRT91552.1 D-hexose-6-phosphate mutarotase [Ancylomarina sp. 16SWW S1-10-2]
MLLDELNNTYGIDNQLTFSKEKHMIIANIESEYASAKLSLYGAQVLSFTPKEERNLIFLSKEAFYQNGKAIRGGIPICWPWFGAHPENKDLPSHGFARLSNWEVIQTSSSKGEIQIKLQLKNSKATEVLWPYKFETQVSLTIGKSLKIKLTTVNKDDKAFTITGALHSYLNISDSEKVKVEGLENIQYRDDVLHVKSLQKESLLSIKGQVDRQYFDTSKTCIVHDPDYKRKIQIDKEGSQITVIWNPGDELAAKMTDLGNKEYQNMLCVEAANNMNDAITIKPNESHSLATQISMILD